jgi:hypothetical protein
MSGCGVLTLLDVIEEVGDGLDIGAVEQVTQVVQLSVQLGLLLLGGQEVVQGLGVGEQVACKHRNGGGALFATLELGGMQQQAPIHNQRALLLWQPEQS